jgi:peptidoglycan hydrolase-like protein with peptidoglycan-binding domain/DNA invertase Pin-like site-specific DNA recombinase
MLFRLLARIASTAIVLTAVAAVALGAPLPAADAATTAPVLEQGSGLGAAPSASVRRVQRILARRGFDLGPPGVDGRFGPRTAAAVRRMQSRYGLVADGVVGPKTRRLLTLLAPSTRRPRATQRPQPARPPRQATPPATTQTAPRPQPQTTPAPPAQTTGPNAAARGDAADTTLPIVLAGLAAALAAAALVVAVARTRGRPDTGAPVLAAIDRELYLEGESDRAGVGSFRGFALATAVAPGDAEDAGHERYLVDDPRKPAPVWVQGDEIRRSPSQLHAGEKVIGYVTVEQDAAREHEAFIAIENACEEADWKLTEIVRDRDTGRMVGRPGLTRALERIAAGDARGLIVSEARSLVRSLADLGALLEWFRDAEAVLVALDLDLDTATVQGHQTASTLIAVSAWDSERTATRARRGLARVQTPERAGAPTGPDDRAALVHRIRAMRDAGMSLQAIADQLTNEGVAPLRGRGWSTATVRTALATSARGRSIRDELPAIPTHDRQG